MSVQFNSQLSQSIGQLLSWNKTSEGLCGETTHGKFRVQLYNDSIIRISITKADIFDDFSYAVITQPSKSDHDITENNNYLIIKTPKFITHIQKNPVRFKFVE